MAEVTRIDRAAFGRWNRRKPCVIVDALAGWSRWSPELLRERIEEQPVMVAVSDDAEFRYSAEVERDADQRSALFRGELMAFDSAFARITESRGPPFYYLMQRSIPDEFPNLVRELPTLPWIPVDDPVVNLWFGQGGVVTPLHYDMTHNFLVQVHGRKRLRLYSPHDTERLYPLPWTTKMAHTSQVDVEQPDLERFPAFAEAEPHLVTLAPGETLWMPAWWWHHVWTLELSISINFWWPAPDQDSVFPNALRELPDEYRRDRLARFAAVNLAPMGLDLADGARLCHEAGIGWAAVLLASAALTERGESALVEAALAAVDRDLNPADVAALVRELG